MPLFCPFGTTRCAPQENVVFPYNKSFIDRACSINMAGYWFFLACLWTSTPFLNMQVITKKTWPITIYHLYIVTQQGWSIITHID